MQDVSREGAYRLKALGPVFVGVRRISAGSDSYPGWRSHPASGQCSGDNFEGGQFGNSASGLDSREGDSLRDSSAYRIWVMFTRKLSVLKVWEIVWERPASIHSDSLEAIASGNGFVG
ncbi:hypothetical protein [Laspinema palackyanum]|uniref:hypothetical protein n=1 Tax=Laspinema palackyanum TaxID=3231601 RepID=UPI00345DAEE2|nr:hypothetical protein [Laspinema sp. D2c]